MEIFNQIFLHHEYVCPSAEHAGAIENFYDQILADGHTPLIIDCGANIGLSAIWFANRYPKARIIAVEPEASNFGILLRNSAPYRAIQAIQVGISDRVGRVSLSNPTDAPWTWQTTESETGTIATSTIAALCKEMGLEARLLIVKIDIEGGEIALFRSNLDWIADAPVIVFEPHDGLYPWSGSFHTIAAALTTHGKPRDYIQSGENIFAFSNVLATDQHVSKVSATSTVSP